MKNLTRFTMIGLFFFSPLGADTKDAEGANTGAASQIALPTSEQIRAFRQGNVVAFSEYVKLAVIMVSVYKRDIAIVESNSGKSTDIIVGTSYARVVQSHNSELKVGDIVVYEETKEGLNAAALYHFSHPQGQLFYLVSPKIEAQNLSRHFYLKQGHPAIPIKGTYYHSDFYK